jgi:hypothetical protein
MENCDKIGLELGVGALALKLDQYLSTGKFVAFVGTKGKLDKFAKTFINVGWEAGAIVAFDKTGITDLGVKGAAAVGLTGKIGDDKAKKTIEFAPEVKIESTVTINSGFEGVIKTPLGDGKITRSWDQVFN